MACEWEDNVKYLMKHVENAEELSLLGFYETGSRLDLDRMTVWNLQSGFLWAAVKVRRQVMDPERVQLLSVKPHQQSSNERIEKRKWKTSMVLPKWGKGLAQEVWCKSDASLSQPSSTWTDTSLAPRESVSKCSRPTRSWRSGWRRTSMRRCQEARPRITCPASSAWVVLSRNMLTVESFGVLGHSRPLRPNCLSLEIDCDSTLLYSAQLLSI